MTKAPPKKSWRDVLKVHPACELFPSLSADELRALGEDIKQNGLQMPIALFWPGREPPQMLDGRSRLDAIEAADMPIKIDRHKRDGRERIKLSYQDGDGEWREIDYLLPTDDPYAYVISANLHRRHLTTGQKRELIAKLLKADPRKSDRRIAEQIKTSPTFVGKVRAEKEATGDVSTVDTRTDTMGRQQPAKKKPQQAATNQTKPAAAPIKQPKPPAPTKPPEPARDDISPNSVGEAARLRARIEELQADKRRLEIKIVALESEIAELKAARVP